MSGNSIIAICVGGPMDGQSKIIHTPLELRDLFFEYEGPNRTRGRYTLDSGQSGWFWKWNPIEVAA
jgi:hypothetical protein